LSGGNNFLIRPKFWEINAMKEISDDLWDRVKPLLKPFKRTKSGGSPPKPFRTILNGILYQLKTGCQWSMIPSSYGSKSTVHEHFQRWVHAGVFDQIFLILLEDYEGIQGIKWKWQSMDGSIAQAPVRGEMSPEEGLGPNPTDRGRNGTKIHILTDATGIPLGVEVVGANVHDSRLITSTVETIAVERPEPAPEKPQNLSLDKGYDYPRVDIEVKKLDYQAHIRRIGEEKLDLDGEKKHPARRWVVERTFAWLKGFRALRTRYFRFGENYLAMVKLACAIIVSRRVFAE
jgi:transposase